MSVERRWRRIENSDECWQYEERDPSFIAKKFPDHSEVDVDGWRPIASVWKYCYSEVDIVRPTFREMSIGHTPKISKRPWRTVIRSEEPKAPRRDYETLGIAKDKVERSITPAESSEVS
jgi:hypothetical protein